MGTLTSALKNSLRNFRQIIIRAPKPPKEQPRPGPTQPLSQSRVEPRIEEGRTHSEAPATNTATATPPTATDLGAGTASVIHAAGVSTSSNPTANNPTTTIPSTTTTTKPTSTTAKMATDEDYAAFLEKANADPNEGYAKPQQKGQGSVALKAVDEGASVPKELKTAVKDQVYVSDADEPFEVVSLKLDGKGELPDEVTFAKLVQHPDPSQADVEILDVARWDAQGEYKELVSATRDATKGSDVIVYRIGREGARVEYWLVGVEGGRLLGVKALAVES